MKWIECFYNYQMNEVHFSHDYYTIYYYLVQTYFYSMDHFHWIQGHFPDSSVVI
ncbi:unnamed protein product [Schistosoma mattheei]|uniref:Uncharacterized protein n=1 Tax=Schistosoma mattheei TaxID=31246 RepID=A0A183NSH4_9TREM|nr:unnamed protein product [Schistosoma mattheei]